METVNVLPKSLQASINTSKYFFDLGSFYIKGTIKS